MADNQERLAKLLGFSSVTEMLKWYARRLGVSFGPETSPEGLARYEKSLDPIERELIMSEEDPIAVEVIKRGCI